MPKGTTSACAENTHRKDNPRDHTGNYLRVRGEYEGMNCRGSRITELPPRARRILPMGRRVRSIAGTTSACAENTHANH